MIPARGGSKRLPRKNIRNLAGKPVIAYTIEAALESDVFTKVVVSTDDDEIASIAESYGAEVPFTRPEKLASDTAQVVDVTDHVLDFFSEQSEEFDFLAVLLPTTPLRTAEDIKNAYNRFDSNPNADFLMCVTDYQYSPFEALYEKQDGRLDHYWNHEYMGMRSQERPDLVVDNGGAYIMNIEAYERQRTFYGSTLIGYYMPPKRSIDIDEQFDLELAEFFLQR
jgi:pseudaminic acid cytidylyltransferase